MRKTVFLHIGEPKSGTSYLQSHLWANRDELREHGIDVPGEAQIDHFHAGSDLRQLPTREGDERRPGAWERLVATLNESDATTVVISDERLGQASSAQVARASEALAPHDVNLIFGVRDFARLLPSEWQQQVKMTGAWPLEAWLSEVAAGRQPWFWKAHDLDDVFARWNVPRDNVHLLIVPGSDSAPDELWRRFASIIGAPMAPARVTARGNESLGLDETELIRRVYEHLEVPPPFRSQRLIRNLVSREILARRPAARSIRLPESCRPWVTEEAARRRGFAESSGCGVVGRLDELDPDETCFAAGVPQPEATLMLDAALDVIAALIDRLVRRSDRPASPDPPSTTPRRATAIPRRLRRQARVAVARCAGRRYYLNVGPPGGANGLQQLLWANRRLLLGSGVYVAGTPPDDDRSKSELQSPAHGSTVRLQETWDALIADAERSGHRKIVITNDRLASATPDDIEGALRRLDGAEVHIVYAVRHLATLLPAVWQHCARSKPTAPWAQWLHGLGDGDETSAQSPWRAHNIDLVLQRWREAGAEHFHLLLYPQSGDVTDVLWERFRSIVGWSMRSHIDVPMPREVLVFEHAELLRRVRWRLGELVAPRRTERIFEDVIINGVLPSCKLGNTLRLPEDVRPWIEAQSQMRRSSVSDGNNHVVGDPRDLEAGDSPFAPSRRKPDEAVMLDAAVRIAARLVEQLAAERRSGADTLRASEELRTVGGPTSP